VKASCFWKLISSPRFQPPAYAALGIAQILIGIRRQNSDDYWFGGMWILVALLGVLAKPEIASSLV
jgi:hypothetical protein